MKKKILFNIIFLIIAVFQFAVFCEPLEAAKKAKGLDEEQVKKIEENIDILTKKIHAYSLFSPEDSDILVEIKSQLNSIADTNLKDPLYAKLFYNAAFLFKEREYNQDAIQCFNVVIKNFPETVYSNRALSELKKLGVNLEEATDETTGEKQD
ncbi:MAG TPA: hypothetical protein P5556_00390 [Candidatus Gastranaerophilales bacterium]|nr:hypothetical protein [Candidatus Gastranaerophilales bacterium]